MRYIGLVKWFDDKKGFGRITTPDQKDIYLNQSNFTNRHENILKGTSLLFEIKKSIPIPHAINVSPPNSYEDFKTILTYSGKNISIIIEETITGKNKRGVPYKYNESISHDLVGESLRQLFKTIPSKNIYHFFIKYFDEQYPLDDSEFVKNYFKFTFNIIFNLRLEVNTYVVQEVESKYSSINNENTIVVEASNYFNSSIWLIQKLFNYYLNRLDNDNLLEIWQSESYYVMNYVPPRHYTDISRQLGNNYINEPKLKFPAEFFIKNYSTINSRGLNQIIKQSDGILIVTEIIKKKIFDLNSISKKSLDEILASIQLLSNSKQTNELRKSFIERVLELLTKYYLSDINKESVEIFNYFINSIKNESNNFKYDVIIRKLNKLISDDSILILWKATKYFKPKKDFFYKYYNQLSYSDIVSAPIDFHEEIFTKNLKQISDLNKIENIGLFTFLIIESRYPGLKDVFSDLPQIYKAAFWINFSKVNILTGKAYGTNANISGIPYTFENFNSYLQILNSLNDLYFASELINRIQTYIFEKNLYSIGERHYKFDLIEQHKIIQRFLNEIRNPTPNDTFEFFVKILKKTAENNITSLFKSFIPKFLNENVIKLDKLLSIVNQLGAPSKIAKEIYFYLYDLISKYGRVYLWFYDNTNNIDINEVVDVIDKFELEKQPKLLRKLFSIIHVKKIIPDNNFFIKLSNLNTSSKLNLDVKICLSVLTSLHNQNQYIGENKISEIICQYINENVNVLLEIKDLFQECKGRLLLSRSDETTRSWFINIEGKEFTVENNLVIINNNHYSFNKDNKTIEIEGKTYNFQWSKKEINFFEHRYDKPAGVTFCDAVKSQEDENLNKVFFWCCNDKCYGPCQNDHTHFEWNSYSLRDFIKILNLPFEEEKYYRFVSVVNRSNRLLKKLRCNSCNKLLRDQQTSEFAFYRVTSFHCTNPECLEYHKFVYLNHCLNWKCLNIVDSRISKTCPNGWYICDSCKNCCSQDKIEKRLKNLITNNAFNPTNPRHQKLKYQVENKLGHLERSEKFNYITGEKIIE